MTCFTSRLKFRFRSPLCVFQSSNEQPSACEARQMSTLEAEPCTHMQYQRWYVRIPNYKNGYHEPEPQDLACELPGIGEADQRWFPHEHLSIRVCVWLRGTCAPLRYPRNRWFYATPVSGGPSSYHQVLATGAQPVVVMTVLVVTVTATATATATAVRGRPLRRCRQTRRFHGSHRLYL